MVAAIVLLVVFLSAVILAFAVTIATGSAEMRLFAGVFVTPIIVLGMIFVYYSIKLKAWAYGGAAILGMVGVALRVVVSTMPSLEVGGGLPGSVTALYVTLGVMVSLENFESVLELRKRLFERVES